MFGVGPWELIFVFAIVLLLFGGKRLPGIAAGLGGAIRNFKSAMRDGSDAEDKKALPKDAQAATAEKKIAETVHS